MADTKVSALDAAYFPAVNAETFCFNVTVTNASQRLGALITIPSVDNTDNPGTGAFPWSTPPGKRPPRHIFFQVPIGAANKVYLTHDNVTVPVAVDGGPGIELQPGVVYPFHNAAPLLTDPGVGRPYRVNAATAFQIVSKTGSQAVSVWFGE